MKRHVRHRAFKCVTLVLRVILRQVKGAGLVPKRSTAANI